MTTTTELPDNIGNLFDYQAKKACAYIYQSNLMTCHPGSVKYKDELAKYRQFLETNNLSIDTITNELNKSREQNRELLENWYRRLIYIFQILVIWIPSLIFVYNPTTAVMQQLTALRILLGIMCGIILAFNVPKIMKTKTYIKPKTFKLCTKFHNVHTDAISDAVERTLHM